MNAKTRQREILVPFAVVEKLKIKLSALANIYLLEYTNIYVYRVFNAWHWISDKDENRRWYESKRYWEWVRLVMMRYIQTTLMHSKVIHMVSEAWNNHVTWLASSELENAQRAHNRTQSTSSMSSSSSIISTAIEEAKRINDR